MLSNVVNIINLKFLNIVDILEFGEYPWHAAILTNTPTGQPGE